MVNFPANYPLVNLYNIPLLRTFEGNKNEVLLDVTRTFPIYKD